MSFFMAVDDALLKFSPVLVSKVMQWLLSGDRWCHFLQFARNFNQNRISQLREMQFADLPKLEYMWVKLNFNFSN